ncbi:hypothetical protein BD413DRAFT_477624 [Trametes elegans]|nr:hypothetical protein BD413DRAFT_477624 [Trametes elegans]
MNVFWEQSRAWLAQHGVNLYEFYRAPNTCGSMPWLCPTSTTQAPLPYASAPSTEEHELRSCRTTSRLAVGQDTERRNIMIKLVDNGSTEHTAYLRMQHEMVSFTDSTTFPCVLPPTAILKTPYEYSFIVTPMWGSHVDIHDISTLDGVFKFIECSLRGLAFLHQIRVAHRDICEPNLVVNLQSIGVPWPEYHVMLGEHRRNNEVLYAFIDYDQAIHLPYDTPLDQCRRPTSETIAGLDVYKPRGDTNLGQPYYNPFAHDVASLGLLYRRYFWNVVGDAPGLAALFDRMTDHVISRRLTAKGALSFYRQVVEQARLDSGQTRVVLERDYDAMDDSELYWSQLTSTDRQVWGRYRTPRLSLWARVLDWIASYPLGWKVLCFVRRSLQL